MSRWLEAFARERSVSNACLAVRKGRTNVYAARKADKAFADAWAEIEETTLDDLETSAMSRAIQGWPEPVIYKGRLSRDDDGKPLFVRKFSNALTIFMLKTRRPERYNIAPGDTGSEGSPQDRARELRAALAEMDASVPTEQSLAAVEDGESEGE
jgi:hypothetical protein